MSKFYYEGLNSIVFFHWKRSFKSVRKLPGDIHSHTNQTRQISPPQLKNQNSPLYTNHSSQAMASHSTLLFSPPNLSPKFSSLFHYSLQSLTFQTKKPSSLSLTNTRKRRQLSVSVVSASHSLQALILDCDGVILESEHLHRQAYNDAFSHFNVRCPPSSQPLNWVPEFYDVLQNRIGGGKPKMRWFLFLIFLGLFFIFLIFGCRWEFFLVFLKVLQGAWMAIFYHIWNTAWGWCGANQVNWHSSGIILIIKVMFWMWWLSMNHG